MKQKLHAAWLLSAALFLLLTACGIGSKTRITLKWVDRFSLADLDSGRSVSINRINGPEELVYYQGGEEQGRVPWKESLAAARYSRSKEAALAMAELIEGYSSSKSISAEDVETLRKEECLYSLAIVHMSSELPVAAFLVTREGELVSDRKDAYSLLTYEEEDAKKLLDTLGLFFQENPGGKEEGDG